MLEYFEILNASHNFNLSVQSLHLYSSMNFMNFFLRLFIPKLKVS